MSPSAGAKRLRLYVDDACLACGGAIEMLDRVIERFPGIDARVIDIRQSTERHPDAVFAVPTFTLDGVVVALGTPTWDALTNLLSPATEGGEA